MSWIAQVVEYLDTNTTLTAGKNLGANALPDDIPDVCVGLFESPGISNDDVYGDVPAFVRPAMMVVVRSTHPPDNTTPVNPTAARRMAWRVHMLLQAVGNQTITATTGALTFGTLEPEAPYLAGLDQAGRQNYEFGCAAWILPTSNL